MRIRDLLISSALVASLYLDLPAWVLAIELIAVLGLIALVVWRWLHLTPLP